MAHTQRHASKRAFYSTLESLTASDDDEKPDPGRQASINALAGKKTYHESAKVKTAVASSAGKMITPTSTAIRESTNSASVPAVAAKSKASRKRKRHEVAIPEAQQIFSGLQFYFFPNTDTHAARKLRIAKAQQYGATWVKDWSEAITHVIFDKANTLEQCLKYNKLEAIPSRMVVVSEDYPAECITSRAILDPGHIQFKVKGYERRPTEPAPEGSLPLKPAGRDVRAREPETPPERTERESEAVPSVSKDDASTEGSAEFDAALSKARTLEIPLDDSSDSEDRADPSEGEPSFSNPKGQSTFQCMQSPVSSNANTTNPNAHTIAILQQMATYYEQMGDDWRCRGYRRAIATLRRQPEQITTRAQALALPQIGVRLATKIEEIAITSRLRRLENAHTDPTDQVLRTFTQIYGVGLKQASQWVSAGYTSLADVREHAVLTACQRVGVEHFEDFNAGIPRAEVEMHAAIVRDALEAIEPGLEVVVGGSYRRGAAMSGDIDCLITAKKGEMDVREIREVVVEKLVPLLKQKGFLVAELAATKRADGTKWHGASVLPGRIEGEEETRQPWRRIDFLLVPPHELGAALIYWTGNDLFNRSMRLLASTKGMRLNQRGLFRDVIRGKGRERITDGTLVEGKDEKRIFEILGVPWREPRMRNC